MTAPTTTFDLAALVRDVCSERTNVHDPAQLAKEIHRRIPPHAYGEALAQALRRIVVVQLGNNARDVRIAPADLEARHHAARRTRAKREWWRAALEATIKTGDDDTAYKALGLCTIDDLTFAAELRDRMAAANAARADEYRQLRGLLEHHGVARVDELPEEVLAATLVPRDR